MPLVQCRDCGAEVSPRAEACPRCGGPMVSGGRSPREIIITEQTAKQWKALQLVGVLMFAAGIVVGVGTLAMGASQAKNPDLPEILRHCPLFLFVVAGILLGLGLVIALVGGIAAWWYHG